ncbi:hypothetical protein BSZ39_09685 [Bowdeniella nasicola]|uniref:Uncharacterized protein n=1 Tax=Bowdeniella nasicola TaxID=208480 RepID=A0A1Q5Q138_9ACTO|nr:hypothetical protein [Bowdeniella nasicola]OKL53412.1 hypothetical protein BSZ39_09685 [Bowdeniella nasicola]
MTIFRWLSEFGRALHVGLDRGDLELGDDIVGVLAVQPGELANLFHEVAALGDDALAIDRRGLSLGSSTAATAAVASFAGTGCAGSVALAGSWFDGPHAVRVAALSSIAAQARGSRVFVMNS